MRLPNVNDTRKLPWLVILQHGKLYPLDVFSQDGRGVPIVNNSDVVYQPSTGYVEPRPEAGQAPESGVAEMAQSFKASGRTNYYFAFWVYDDSFPAFVTARETAVKLGLQYGWNPLPANQRLRLSRQGERVLPQN